MVIIMLYNQTIICRRRSHYEKVCFFGAGFMYVPGSVGGVRGEFINKNKRQREYIIKFIERMQASAESSVA